MYANTALSQYLVTAFISKCKAPHLARAALGAHLQMGGVSGETEKMVSGELGHA